MCPMSSFRIQSDWNDGLPIVIVDSNVEDYGDDDDAVVFYDILDVHRRFIFVCKSEYETVFASSIRRIMVP